jgi:predicted TIM-barrel fold metal-dependent hydrolase
LCRPDHFCQISATFLSKFSASSFFFSKTQIISEYNELLQAQLENQKQYFEKLLQNVKEETEQKISEAASKAISQRLQKLQTRFDRCVKEKQFLEDVSLYLAFVLKVFLDGIFTSTYISVEYY